VADSQKDNQEHNFEGIQYLDYIISKNKLKNVPVLIQYINCPIRVI
jgi:hypothetical protein